MFSAQELLAILDFSLSTHDQSPRLPRKQTRKFDGKTPFGAHPTWAALTILLEPNLPEDIRVAGAHTLALHDILEDTFSELPEETPENIRKLVDGMTYMDGLVQEMIEVWQQPPIIRLFKLYDKVSNQLDGSWMSPQQWRDFADYTLRLADDVEHNYGMLNIIRLARAMSAE